MIFIPCKLWSQRTLKHFQKLCWSIAVQLAVIISGRIPLENRSRLERFKRFSGNVWAIWAVWTFFFLKKPPNRSNLALKILRRFLNKFSRKKWAVYKRFNKKSSKPSERLEKAIWHYSGRGCGFMIRRSQPTFGIFRLSRPKLDIFRPPRPEFGISRLSGPRQSVRDHQDRRT